MKKVISLVMSLIMVFSLVSVASATGTELTPNENGLYPDAVYDASAELDADGKWIYRELAVNGGIEESDANKDNIVYSTYKSTTYSIDNAVKRTGSSSLKATPTAAYAGVGVKLDTSYVEGETYRLSYYINPTTTLSKVTNRWPYFYRSTTGYGRVDSVTNSFAPTGGLLADTWNLVDDKKTFTSATGKLNEASQKSFAGLSVDTTLPSGGLTYYLDDFSVRRVPANLETFPSAYVKSVSPSFTRPIIGSDNKVSFTFSMDVDERTVRKEFISVNGVENSVNIANVDVTSVVKANNEIETTLEITMTGLVDGNSYTISLDDVKDPWGRDVVGTKSVTVYKANVTDGQYTIFDDLDAEGKWIYRELAINGGIEVSEANKDNVVYSTYGSTTYSVDSTIKRTGSSCLKATPTAAYAGVGVKLDTSYVEGETYRLSYYINPTTKLTKVTNRWPYFYKNATGYGRVDSVINSFAPTGGLLANTWNLVDDKKTFTSATGKLNEASQKSFAGLSVDTTLPSGGLTYYLDDFSVRRVPAFDVYLTGKTLSADGRTVTFTFDKDIDTRFATTENIVANGATPASVNVNTNEITRVTTMAVTFDTAVELDDVSYTANLKDAWGRAIKEKALTLSFESAGLSQDGKTFTVTGIENYSGKTVKVGVIIASYDNNNQLVQAVINSQELTHGTAIPQLSATLTEDGYTSVKTFVWDMNTLVPYYINE